MPSSSSSSSSSSFILSMYISCVGKKRLAINKIQRFAFQVNILGHYWNRNLPLDPHLLFGLLLVGWSVSHKGREVTLPCLHAFIPFFSLYSLLPPYSVIFNWYFPIFNPALSSFAASICFSHLPMYTHHYFFCATPFPCVTCIRKFGSHAWNGNAQERGIL